MVGSLNNMGDSLKLAVRFRPLPSRKSLALRGHAASLLIDRFPLCTTPSFAWIAGGKQPFPVGVGAASQREEYSAPPVFSQAGRARVERSGFLTECYLVIALAASVRPHNTNDSDRHDRNPMATIRGGIIGWYKNRILTRRLS